MTAIDNTPNNRNFMSPLNFKFQIKKTPNVNFFIQKVNVPEITLPDATSSTPLVNVPYPGDHLIYGTLNITFKVDEDFQNYMEIHNWMKALGKPKEYEQYAAIEKLPQ